MKSEHSGRFRLLLRLGALVAALPLLATGFSPPRAGTGHITGGGGANEKPSDGRTRPGKMPGAPYLYMGWGNPPSATSVMSATGIKSFTMAFLLSGGGCTPMWDGSSPGPGTV